MTGKVKEDIFTTYFGSIWSRATNGLAETSTERGCQSTKWWHKRMETKRIFLNHFYHPRFASGYDQNQFNITDVSKQKRQRIVPKLMISVPKWNKRINQRKLMSNFAKFWTRITRWLTEMPKVIEWYRNPEKWLETELSIKIDIIGNE